MVMPCTTVVPLEVESVESVDAVAVLVTESILITPPMSIFVILLSAGAASAESKITKIDIGGVIKIDSVTSTATASTDSTDSTSSGTTVVQGMTIGGQAAYVDDNGVHIGDQGQPANAVVSQIANNALKNGGFSFAVSQPQQEVDGPTSSYTAGALYVVWKPPQSENVFVIALGGSRVSVTAK